MKIARLALLGLMLVLPEWTSAAANKIDRLDFEASAWIEVDATGHARVEGIERVSKLGDVEELAPAVANLKSLLQQRIESWEFVPATRDGAAVPSRTHLSLDLEAFDDGKGGLAIRILDADTGAKLRTRPLGRLIAAMMKTGRSGRAVIRFAFDSNGAVTEAEMVASAGIAGGKMKGKLDKALAKALTEAMRDWSFEPETVAGQGVPGGGRVPVWFCLENECGDLKEAAGETETRLASEDPVVRLRSRVAGMVL